MRQGRRKPYPTYVPFESWLPCSGLDEILVSLLRKENELAVLIQYIDRNKLEPPAATFLDIILYSREQIRLENLATGDATADTDAPWGIISVKVRNATANKVLPSMSFATIYVLYRICFLL